MENPFFLLPEELLRLVFSFADIPSLSALSQTSKSPVFQYASHDTTWAGLVERRFCIRTRRSVPRLHGGSTWKDAYRSLSYCNRIPRTRYTSKQKIVFAKGGGGTSSKDGVSVWVLVGHTENCEIRTCRHSLNIGNPERYIALRLCVQNTRSTGEVAVDVTQVSIKMSSSTSENNSSLAVARGPMKPRILALSGSKNQDDLETMETANDLTLGPLAFAVVAIHIPCTSDMMYETDFLCRASLVRVPIKACPHRLHSLHGDREAKRDLYACAYFLPEDELWNHYLQLPGGFLSLTDRSRLLTV